MNVNNAGYIWYGDDDDKESTIYEIRPGSKEVKDAALAVPGAEAVRGSDRIRLPRTPAAKAVIAMMKAGVKPINITFTPAVVRGGEGFTSSDGVIFISLTTTKNSYHDSMRGYVTDIVPTIRYSFDDITINRVSTNGYGNFQPSRGMLENRDCHIYRQGAYSAYSGSESWRVAITALLAGYVAAFVQQYPEWKTLCHEKQTRDEVNSINGKITRLQEQITELEAQRTKLINS